MALRFTLNGEPVEAEGDDPHTTLLQWLRDRGLTGTKEGCAEGECGACAVALVRRDPQGRTRYDAINSCLMLLGATAGHEVWTVEGVGRPGALHPVQRAMVEQGGSQCGYCTPGFVVSMFAEYYRPDREGFDPESIGGNLCRCTGYRPIRDAVRAMGEPRDDDAFRRRLREPPPSLEDLRAQGGPASRRLYRPTGLAELFDVLGREPDACLVAGGTDVVVDMNQRHDRHDVLVSVDAVQELSRFAWHDDALEIGAAVPLREVEERVEGALPMMEQLLPLFSSRLIRNRATLGGNLATASPIGDSPPVLLALGAEVLVAGPGGERTIAVDELFTGYRQTALSPGEVIVSVRIPRPFPRLQRFYKVSKRVLDDISTVAAAFAVDVDEQGKVTRARLALGGVAPTPIRATGAEDALVGRPWTLETARAAASVLASDISPISDHRGSDAYRRAVVPKLLDKLWHETEDERDGSAA
ncbi:MAG: xanthine dehydrogenase small subunit [Polyangiales bacterium]